ncbi:MAG: hypothetical protein K2P26_10025, partial [Oscillospiraceae bacterium]|nr:hypothetical protein [Oscillospiraceae bacterium]
LSILSLCLPRDVHFQHDFQLQKTQFPQLFPLFSSACPPLRFSHSDGIFAHDIPHQNPLHFPHSSSLSGEAYGESFVQNIVLFAKIPYFLVQISVCPGVRVGGFSEGEQGET